MCSRILSAIFVLASATLAGGATSIGRSSRSGLKCEPGSITTSALAAIEACEIGIAGSSHIVAGRLRRDASDNHVVLEVERVESSATTIITNGVDLTVAVADSAGIAYPLIQHVEKRAAVPTDPALKEKFLRLKRMLVHFRSHNKWALAKYRYKIEHARVLGNESGPAILEQLRKVGILTLSGSMYFLDPA